MTRLHPQATVLFGELAVQVDDELLAQRLGVVLVIRLHQRQLFGVERQAGAPHCASCSARHSMVYAFASRACCSF